MKDRQALTMVNWVAKAWLGYEHDMIDLRYTLIMTDHG